MREASEKLDELYREVKAEGGADLVKQLRLAVKIREPEKREALIHKLSTESQVVDWTENAPRNRTPKLEDPKQGGIQAGTSSLWGDSKPDAESSDGDPEAGDGEEGEDIREVQPANSFTFLD